MNEYIDPMKPLFEAFMTDFHIEEENHIMRAVSDIGISVDKDRLVQALTDAHKFYEEGYIAGKNFVYKHGHWIDSMGSFRCSVCGDDSAEYVTNYCPMCGARMEGKRRDDG